MNRWDAGRQGRCWWTGGMLADGGMPADRGDAGGQGRHWQTGGMLADGDAGGQLQC